MTVLEDIVRETERPEPPLRTKLRVYVGFLIARFIRWRHGREAVDFWLWEMTPFPAGPPSWDQILTGFECGCRKNPDVIRAREMAKFDRLWARCKEKDARRSAQRC